MYAGYAISAHKRRPCNAFQKYYANLVPLSLSILSSLCQHSHPPFLPLLSLPLLSLPLPGLHPLLTRQLRGWYIRQGHTREFRLQGIKLILNFILILVRYTSNQYLTYLLREISAAFYPQAGKHTF